MGGVWEARKAVGFPRGSALTVQRLRVGKVLFKLLVQVLADADVLEHALEFGGVLKTTCLLQKKIIPDPHQN